MRYRYHCKTMRPDVLDQIQRAAVARYLERVVGSTFGYSHAMQVIIDIDVELVSSTIRTACATPIARLVPVPRDDFDDDEVTAERTMIGPALGPARAPGRSQL